MQPKAIDFFTQEQARKYDEKNSRLSPISNNLQFLMKLIFEGMPSDARVLCVGAGTGADILALAEEFPEWSFVAAEPSLSMLDVCRDRMNSAGLSARCEFFHGYASDLPSTDRFDIATSLYVGHFVERDDRESFYGSIINRLRSGGCLVNAEISYDLNSDSCEAMVRNWKSVQRLMGGSNESLKEVPRQLRDVLTVLSPDDVEKVFASLDVGTPIRFFQAFMITAWHMIRR